VRQLEATAKLPNVVFAIGMPDLHPGKGFPIGSATATSSVFYPHLGEFSWNFLSVHQFFSKYFSKEDEIVFFWDCKNQEK
jgi:hypothetical protein